VALAPVVQTPFGPLGLVLGREGHEHRLIANLAGMGVGMFAWITSGLVHEHEIVARARAMESRVWVATANPARIVGKADGPEAHSGLSLIAEPDGRVASCAFPDEEQIISSYCDLCLTERAEAVPGTLATR
jgi:predicted amidohydrolase